MEFENAILVINKTRLESLIERFNTIAQARFYIERSGGNFSEYEQEHKTFEKVKSIVTKSVSRTLKLKVLQRNYLPNYIFSKKDVILVLGQDGLVANTAKYAKGIPILAINPDPERYDGVLLPFYVDNFEPGLKKLLYGNNNITTASMAEATLNDGQKLMAFNDLFIGQKTHVSARYKLTFNGITENHSSSGIIISTGAGSTGWLSSLFNMTKGMNQTFGQSTNSDLSFTFDWASENLAFVVREPFKSVYTDANMTAGMVTQNKYLKIESFMPNNGVIFSDGIENDYLDFNSGSIAHIGIAKEKANLVIQ